MKQLQKEHKRPDRRVLWLKKLYLQLCNRCKYGKKTNEDINRFCPRPIDALQAFGGRVERWKGFPLLIYLKSVGNWR